MTYRHYLLQLQPTWFLSRKRFESLGGYLNAPTNNTDETNSQKRTKIIPDTLASDGRESVAADADISSKQFYRLFHPSEILDTTISKGTIGEKRKKCSQNNEKSANTLRLAEDTRFFYAHLNAGGRLHLHRTPSPLVSYRHRFGMSQSSSTPRKLLLKLRAKAWEDMVFSGNSVWANGFAIWGAGRDGKDFLKALSQAAVSKVVCFVDVDQNKIERIKWYDNPALGGRRIPILHFSVLAKNVVAVDEVTFGKIDKKQRGEDCFDIAQSKHLLQTEQHNGSKQKSVSKTAIKNWKKESNESIDSEVLHQLPVVVCVAMYRTKGALERNVASIGRVEGKDLWHIM